MKPVFDPAAAEEIEEAADWYEAHKSGLGRDFVVEVNASIRRIIEFPNAWPPVSRRVRHLQLTRFPYAIFYQMRSDEILIVAVAHLHRRPEYWIGGVKSDE